MENSLQLSAPYVISMSTKEYKPMFLIVGVSGFGGMLRLLSELERQRSKDRAPLLQCVCSKCVMYLSKIDCPYTRVNRAYYYLYQ